MKVAIIQSNFIPWRGYFDMMDDVELFVYYDDTQFTRRDWRNRNKIKTANGPEWITVPVSYGERSQLINDTLIDYSSKWITKTVKSFKNNYGRASYFDEYSKRFFDILGERPGTISELNMKLNAWIMEILGIDTKIKKSEEFDATGIKTDRLLDILVKAGASEYLSGPSAMDYIEEDKFRKADISLEYKKYDYEEYPQLFGAFEPNVTILDLIFNCGPQAKRFLKSRTPNEKVL